MRLSTLLLLSALAGASACASPDRSGGGASARSETPSAAEDPLGLLGLSAEELSDRHGRAEEVEALHGVQARSTDPRSSGERIHAVHRYASFEAYLNLSGEVIGYAMSSGAAAGYGSCPDPEAG